MISSLLLLVALSSLATFLYNGYTVTRYYWDYRNRGAHNRALKRTFVALTASITASILYIFITFGDKL